MLEFRRCVKRLPRFLRKAFLSPNQCLIKASIPVFRSELSEVNPSHVGRVIIIRHKAALAFQIQLRSSRPDSCINYWPSRRRRSVAAISGVRELLFTVCWRDNRVVCFRSLPADGYCVPPRMANLAANFGDLCKL
ncbi:hypothetical protein TcasGA2_TC013102 [Tribolium castaneum]|uniref:Uncharacterized protein n=1 Tax=Tribolium castaneum TaxID=7070 RepID=D6WP10_TRICA|nr:hypothetical protein TcasGA2_TC013102 [Tribolium castaneum]